MKVSIVLPFYNNYESIDELFQRLENVAKHKIFDGHEIQLVLIDDGSTDLSYKKLLEKINESNAFQFVLQKLTRNFGSYNAFLAGVSASEGDCCVYLHADLQDPPELIPEMFDKYLGGNSVVIANRDSREDANLFSSIYQYLIKRFVLKNAPAGGFDLVLFDKKIRADLINLSEKNTNNVYLINWLAYPYASIPYNRKKRKYGVSQWSFLKKSRLFVDTFFSFSLFPIYIVRLGFLIAQLLFLGSLVGYFIQPSNSALIILVGSVVLSFVSLNFILLGEYIIRIHETVRNRPNFVIEKSVKRN